MIGASSIWPKFFFLLVFGVFAIAFISAWLQVVKKKAAVTAKLLLESLFFLLWGFMFLQLFAREALFHRDLSRLRYEAVESIQVGNRTLDESKAISEVVHSLNEAQWFESNHGGWAAEVPFVLRFGSGARRTYHVALYLRQGGAVLISMSNFDRAGEGTGWSNGIAFSRRLPAVLAANGIDLPQDKTERWENQKPDSAKAASGRWSSRMASIAIFGFFALSALAVLYRLVKGKGRASDSQQNVAPQLNLVATIGGLDLVSIVAAGCALRLIFALFDWPDPTNSAMIVSVWLFLCAGGTILVLQRHRQRIS